MHFIYRAADRSYAVMRVRRVLGHIDWHDGWHFFPEPSVRLSEEDLRRIATKLEELNTP